MLKINKLVLGAWHCGILKQLHAAPGFPREPAQALAVHFWSSSLFISGKVDKDGVSPRPLHTAGRPQ